ncbi:MAG: type II/IV secretion system ATPase subunit [Candidatus Aenigmarchaeota archaeon]|nr:type II/IV secretion system ATPase subunit [Candidatus Aenigmarchaeota archaeon]MDW8159824.1 type II/IV secretion system ATPase subunit [Candidatus Aenigmarchaeota archaeon]
MVTSIAEKIKSLRGIGYKKLKEMTSSNEEKTLPGFILRKVSKMVELPKKYEDITQVDITYPVLEPFSYVNIKWDSEQKMLIYRVIEPELSKEEKEVLDKICKNLMELVEISFEEIKEESKALEYIKSNVEKVIKSLGLKLSVNQYLKMMYYIYRDFIGYNEINTILNDPYVEDISCDGINIPVYVVHRRFGSLKTNVVFTDGERLRKFIIKLAQRSGRYVSYAEPILDSSLPDGSRVAATIAQDVATRGGTFTIRKFTEKPFSPVEQLELNTVDEEVLAYLWLLIEHRSSMLVVGGTATGKTSFLNSICMFIKPEAKIVSIEDTRELRLVHEHWVPGLARPGFGIPLPSGEKYGSVTLFDLLKEAFRQNPDYVIVGETRGEEAYVLFQGIASGHASLSTFHAGSAGDVVRRLISPPIELPPSLLESLDVIVVMTFAKEKGKAARRVKEIEEIERVDENGNVKTVTIYKWDPISDTFQKLNESIKLKKIASNMGVSYEEILKELERRKKFLRWLLNQGIKDYTQVTKNINEYYKDPKKFWQILGEVVVESKPVERVEKMEIVEKFDEKKRIERKRSYPVLKLLGLKLMKEGNN